MTVATVITEGFGSFGAASLVITQGFGISDTPPAPPDEPTDVGGGRIYYQGGKKRKHRKRIAENVREWIDEAYAEMTAPAAPKEVRVAAARIVKPVSNTKYAVPRASQVDWSALMAEQQKLQQLLSLYEKVDGEYRRMRAEIEDEDAVIMGMFL